jgi:ubiquinone/menaquinone biosynthesis C-methylase UbiE
MASRGPLDPRAGADQKKAKVAGIFDRAATQYGRIGPSFFAQYGRRLVELAQIPSGSRVLDVATGRGAVLFPVAERVGPSGAVIGIDLSEEMVRTTGEDVRRRGLQNVEIRRMDAEELSFADASFDHVLCGLGLFFFPDVLRALSEIRRVLRQGGVVAASTWGKEEPAWDRLYSLGRTYAPPDSPRAGSAGSTAPDFETPQGMQALCSEAGFVNVQVFQEAADFVYASKEEWWKTQWSHGARGTIERIEGACGAEGLVRFKAEVFGQLDEMAGPDGIHHRMPILFTIGANP